MKPLLAPLIAGVVASTTPAAAQDTDAKAEEALTLLRRDAQDESIFKFDYGVPTSPALALAGASESKTTTSTSLKSFVLSVPQFLQNDDGQAIALDIAPAAGFWSKRTVNEYLEQNTRGQLLARSRIGVAALPGKDETDKADTPSRLALGYSVSVLSESDPFFVTALDPDGKRVNVWSACTAAVSRDLFNDPDLRKTLAAPSVGGIVAGNADYFRVQFSGLDDVALGQKVAGYPEETRRRLDAVLAYADQPGSALLTPAQIRAAVDAASAKGNAALNQSEAARQQALRKLPVADTVREGHKACAKLASTAAEAERDLDLGFGAVWAGEPGDLSGFDDPGGALWAAYRHPLTTARLKADRRSLEPGPRIATGGSVRAAWREAVTSKDPTRPEFAADVVEAWVGLEANTEPFRLTAQYGWYEAKARDQLNADLSYSGDRYLITAAIPVLGREAGVWLNLSYGAAGGATEEQDDERVLVTLQVAPPDITEIFKAR